MPTKPPTGDAPEDGEPEEDEIGPYSLAEASRDVLTSQRFWTHAKPLAERWLAYQEKTAAGFVALGWGYAVVRLAVLASVVALMWNDKVTKEVGATLLGGIVGALFAQPREKK